MPVEAGLGDPVYAGSINGTGVLEVEVTAAAEDNSPARIVRIVEAEQARKGASQRLADRIARPLVPAIMVAAALIASVGESPWRPRLVGRARTGGPGRGLLVRARDLRAGLGRGGGRRGQQEWRAGQCGAALEALGTIRGVALDKVIANGVRAGQTKPLADFLIDTTTTGTQPELAHTSR